MLIDQSPPPAFSQAPASPAIDCDRLKLPENLLTAGGIYIGEIHGTQESPQVVLCVVNQILEAHKGPVVFVFELPDASADLTSSFWSQTNPDGGDGRSSIAMADLVTHMQALGREHANLKLVYMDNCVATGTKPEDLAGYRDACMGRTLEAQTHNGYLVAYSGNFHNLRDMPKGASPSYFPAGHFLTATVKTAAIMAYTGGSYWNFGVKAAPPLGLAPQNGGDGLGFAADPSHAYDYAIFIKSYSASTPYVSPLSPLMQVGADKPNVVIDQCDLPPAMAEAPGIVFGAPQGTNEAPAVFTCLVKAALKVRTGPVTIALDMPVFAQDTGSAYWTAQQRGGHNSQAIRAQWIELSALARKEPRLNFDFQNDCNFDEVPADVSAALNKCYVDHLIAVAHEGFVIAQRDLDFSYRRDPPSLPNNSKPMAGFLDPAIKTLRFEVGPQTGFHVPDDHEFDYTFAVSSVTPATHIVAAAADNRSDEPPVNGVTLKDLGIERLISQRQANLIFTYSDRSNAVREALQHAMNESASTAREDHVQTALENMRQADESVHPAITALITHGFWLNPLPRNGAFDTGVWLALQHIFDQPLVDITLEQTAPLVKSGQFPGEQWALMYDRNEVAHNRPQKFGSQITCKAGVMVPYDLVDPAHVDDFRKAYGFTQTLQEYQAMFKGRGCG